MTIEGKSSSAGHAERLVRALLLLLCSAIFSFVAWAAGLYQIENQSLLYGIIGGIVVAAILVSRFGAKLVTRRLTKRASPQ